LGLLENPLILALPPASDTQAQRQAARALADQFTQRTGSVVVTVVPDSYSALVKALEQGNAHIVLLDPFSYALAYQKGLVNAAYAVMKEEETTYGAQFIASRKGGFKSYFNESSQTNFAEAAEALAQFDDKKPCWSEESSPSGYVIPLGYLNKNQVNTRPAAFVQGHPTVVRSVYAGGICDFGATYVDARKFPSLEDQYPDLMEQVLVVWRIPDIIPYAVLAFSTNIPPDMRDLFIKSIPAMLQTTDGKTAFKAAYDIDELLPVNDAYYAEFREYVHAAQVELESLVR
jgi:phosphonate transport system substrate-binding protein